MILNLKLNEVESKQLGESLPLGQYECVCSDVRWGRSAQKGTLYLALTWKCVEEGEFKGQTVTEFKWITDGTLPWFKGWAENLGVLFKGSGINERAFVGRYARVNVDEEEQEQYDGSIKMRRKVESWRSNENGSHNKKIDGSHGAAQITPEQIQQDQSQSSGYENRVDTTTSVTDDDVPF